MSRASTDGYALLQKLNPQHAHVVQVLAAAVVNAGKDLHLVGGPVRDLLYGIPPSDIDFTTSAIPSETRVIGEAISGSSIHDIGEKYGTIESRCFPSSMPIRFRAHWSTREFRTHLQIKMEVHI